MLDPSSKGTVKMKFQVPVDYLSKRGRLLITPRLVAPDGKVADMYEPVAVDAPVYAKKIYRKKVLEGYVDSLPGQVVRADRWSELMEIPYETRVAVPEGWDDAYIDALVSVEGCASCGIIDTLFVAKLRQSEPVDTFSLQWIRPTLAKRPKVMEGKGIAVLQFTINRSDIDGSLGDNRAELEKMAKTLRPILEDSLASVHSIHIIGMASADGPFGFNTNLAYQRAVAAGRWLQDRMAIAPEMKERILADVRPEGWEPVLEAMRQAGDPVISTSPLPSLLKPVTRMQPMWRLSWSVIPPTATTMMCRSARSVVCPAGNVSARTICNATARWSTVTPTR